MKRRNTYRNRHTSNALSVPNGFSWTYFLITIVAGLIFATGLFFAARQHFVAMELGIKNAKLRNQLNDLENEKRRLVLERTVARTPQHLKKNAKALGFREDTELAEAGFTEDRLIAAAAITAADKASKADAAAQPAIAKTPEVKPAESKSSATATATTKKAERPERERKATAAEPNRSQGRARVIATSNDEAVETRPRTVKTVLTETTARAASKLR
jgi:hypothetical protein